MKRNLFTFALGALIVIMLLRAEEASASSFQYRSSRSIPSTSQNGQLNGVAAVSTTDVWAVGTYLNGSNATQTLVEHWDGTKWSVISSPNIGTEDALIGVAAISTSDVWAVGYSSINTVNQTLIEHWNGTQWNIVSSPNAGSQDTLSGVTITSANDVWAVGYLVDKNNATQTLIEHWNGTQWSIVSSPNVAPYSSFLTGVSAISANDAWAVAYYLGNINYPQTLTEHWNGSQWSIVTSPNPTCYNPLYGVTAIPAKTASGGSSFWAVGVQTYICLMIRNQTLIMQWGGSKWAVKGSPNPGPDQDTLNGVAANSAHDAWSVGNVTSGNLSQTLIEHWDGTQWSAISSPNIGSNSNLLSSVTTISTNDAWTVGTYLDNSNVNQTLTEHWDGTQWNIISSPNMTK